MSETGIDAFRVACVLGYCLLPMVVMGAISVVVTLEYVIASYFTTCRRSTDHLCQWFSRLHPFSSLRPLVHIFCIWYIRCSPSHVPAKTACRISCWAPLWLLCARLSLQHQRKWLLKMTVISTTLVFGIQYTFKMSFECEAEAVFRLGGVDTRCLHLFTYDFSLQPPCPNRFQSRYRLLVQVRAQSIAMHQPLWRDNECSWRSCSKIPQNLLTSLLRRRRRPSDHRER